MASSLAQNSRAEHGFLKVQVILGNSNRASARVHKAGNVGCWPFPSGKEPDFCVSGRRSSELSCTALTSALGPV